MFDIGGPELMLIVLAIIVLFGPKKLPEMLQMFKKGMVHVRKAQVQIKSQIDDISTEIKDVADVDIMKEIKEINPNNINYETKKERIKEILSEGDEDKATQLSDDVNKNVHMELDIESNSQKPPEETDEPAETSPEIEIKKPVQKTVPRNNFHSKPSLDIEKPEE